MSTVAAPAASLTTDAPTSPTQTSSPSSHNGGTATLYLFTFLATILILVLLSASLVLRSYILRTRYRQRFQQALADGLFAGLDDTTGPFDPSVGFRRAIRRLGPTPTVVDAWICPADDLDAWPSLTPVALRCAPPSSPSTQSPSSSSPSIHAPRPSLLAQLRIQSPLLSPRPSPPPPPPRQGPSPVPTTLSGTRSPPPAASTLVNRGVEATLAVCVLVAMPDPSAPTYCPAADAKGKGVDPLESHPQNGDKDPLLQTHVRPRDDDEGLPLLEFGVVEVNAGEWVWTI